MATIIVKVTESCNSNCRYCDVIRKLDTGQTMTEEILKALFIKSNEYLQNRPDETLEILWHGGEPLLPGIPYYKNILKLLQKYCPNTRLRMKHSIQTNLTCLTEDYVKLLLEFGITAVGTSYDPEPNMRGIGKNVDTITYNRKFLHSLRLLDNYGIGWGLIYVVTQKSLEDPVSVFYFLTNLLLTGGVNFNPVLIYDKERRNISITPLEFVDFLGIIFPFWWENRNRYSDIEPFKSLVNNIIHGHRHLACVDSGECTYHHINVAPNGDTSQCGRSSDWKLLDYGNIVDSSLEDILLHKERDQLKLRVEQLHQGECSDCRFWELCHGGCPLDSWSEHKDFKHKSEWCYAKTGFITKYFEPVTGVSFQPDSMK